MCSPRLWLVPIFLVLCTSLLKALGAAPSLAEARPFSLSATDLLAEANREPNDKTQDAVVLLRQEHYVFGLNGSLRSSSHVAFQILTAEGVQTWSSIATRWEPWHEQKPSFRARVINPDGSVHELDPRTVSEAPAGGDGQNSFSDARVEQVPLPAVSVGSVVEELIENEQTPVLGSVLFREYIGASVPVRQTQINVEYPSSLPFQYQAFLLPELKAARTVEGETVLLKFDAFHSPAFKPELPLLPPQTPRWPNITFSTAPSWSALAQTYSTIFERQLAAGPPPKFTPSSPVSGNRTNLISQIVRRLHREVRYTGVEFADAAVIPATPAETLNRKYGDCKDKATLLVAMLRSAGIPAYIALLNAGFGEDIHPQLAGMGLFNHAIVFVPASPNSGSADLWIDATAEKSSVGTLPSMDQGRQALVIRENTKTLSTIPDSASAQSTLHETRRFQLPQYGKSQVTEISQGTGNEDAALRSEFGFAEREQMRKNLESYMRHYYDSEGKVTLEHTDPDDYSSGFRLTLKVMDARRGTVLQSDGAVGIPIGDIFNRLPLWFVQDDSKTPSDTDTRAAARTDDFVLPEAFVTEWQYQIALPRAFVPKRLPPAEDRQFGPAHLAAHYEAVNGTICVYIRFDTGKRRYTVAEANELKKAVLEWRKAEMPTVTFEPEGQALINAGKIGPAIVAYRNLTSADPTEPMHEVRLSQALLLASCGPQARHAAEKATEIAPASVIAWQNLGLVRTYDLVGRQFKKGWDPSGSEQALRKAVELDPKDTAGQRNLAAGLEYDENGIRYADPARLKKALSIYEGLTEEQLSAEGLTDNPLFVLAYLSDAKQLRERLRAQPDSPAHNTLRVVATTELDGSKAAVQELANSVADAGARAAALHSAADILARTEHYAESADLLLSSAQDQGANPAVSRASVLRNVKRVQMPETLKGASPEQFAAFYVAKTLTVDSPEELLPYYSQKLLQGALRERLESHLSQSIANAQAAMARSGLTRQMLVDFGLSLAQFTAEQNGTAGCRVRVNTGQAQTQEFFFLVREGNEWKLLGDGQMVGGVARLALDELDRGEAAEAIQWLDWIRQQIKISGGDDPLGGAVFPRIWQRGGNTAPDHIRFAAETLLDSIEASEPSFRDLRERAQSGSGSEKTYAQLAYARACFEAKRYADALPILLALDRENGGSDTVVNLVANAYVLLGRTTDAEAFLRARLAKDPENPSWNRALAEALAQQRRFAEAEAVEKKVAESDGGTVNDWNQYGWFSLLGEDLTPEKISVVQRAAAIDGNPAPALLHTLASMYAEAGRPSEAREVVLQAMAGWGLSEPNEACWYVFGRIAEQYGIENAAFGDYSRLKRPDEPLALVNSTYALAQRRIAALAKSRAILDVGLAAQNR